MTIKVPQLQYDLMDLIYINGQHNTEELKSMLSDETDYEGDPIEALQNMEDKDWLKQSAGGKWSFTPLGASIYQSASLYMRMNHPKRLEF